MKFVAALLRPYLYVRMRVRVRVLRKRQII
jgi:hypothetical protein